LSSVYSWSCQSHQHVYVVIGKNTGVKCKRRHSWRWETVIFYILNPEVSGTTGRVEVHENWSFSVIIKNVMISLWKGKYKLIHCWWQTEGIVFESTAFVYFALHVLLSRWHACRTSLEMMTSSLHVGLRNTGMLRTTLCWITAVRLYILNPLK